MRALGDAALIRAMREDKPEAWQEFDARFRPLLEAYAERTGIPHGDWDSCVISVLDDAAMRLGAADAEIPASVQAYLVRAAYYARLHLQRDTTRRERNYELAGRDANGDGVIRTVCSEAALRDSEDPFARGDERARTALERFIAMLDDHLDVEERHILGWVGEGVPRRQIAEWMGGNYEAVRKRILRIGARLRRLIPALVSELQPADRVEVERILRRFDVIGDSARAAANTRKDNAG
jgi:DNA-directed RNA polymerase specialized sigma24 family protein